jgi:rhodanese-related sulfurtransferase
MDMGFLGKIFGPKESKQEKREERLAGAEETPLETKEKPVETVETIESASAEEIPIETTQSEPVEKGEELKESMEFIEEKPVETMQSELMKEELKPVKMSPEASTSRDSREEGRDPFINLDGEEVVSYILEGRFQILDVRTPREYESHRIPNSRLMPLQHLESRYTEIDLSREILVVCEHGIRSQDACLFLSEMGFKRLYHLTGGLSSYRGPQEGKSYE